MGSRLSEMSAEDTHNNAQQDESNKPPKYTSPRLMTAAVDGGFFGFLTHSATANLIGPVFELYAPSLLSRSAIAFSAPSGSAPYIVSMCFGVAIMASTMRFTRSKSLIAVALSSRKSI